MKKKTMNKLLALIMSGSFAVCALAACTPSSGTGTSSTGSVANSSSSSSSVGNSSIDAGNSASSSITQTMFESDAVLYSDGLQYTTTTKGTPKSYAALSYEFLGGKDVMPIGGFYGPYSSGGSLDGNERADLLSDKTFKDLQDAGINMIVYGKDMWMGEDGGATANLILDLCEKYGIGYYMQSQWVESQLGGKLTPYPTENMALQTPAGINTLQRIINNMTKNGTRKCVLGLHARDEAFVHEVRNLAVLFDAWYNKMDNNYGLDLYGNSLGYWDGKNTLFGTTAAITYQEYLDDYLNVAKPKMFSATQYPFTSASTPEANLTAGLFEELTYYRELTIEQGIPFWRMMQAGGQWNDASAWIPSVTPYQSEAELLFDVNIALAYGSKAIQYFTLVQPMHFAYQEGGTYDYERNGLIGANGNLTRWYYYAQRANNQVKAVDEYLMNAASEGVIVHGPKARKYIVDDAKPNNTVFAENTYKEMIGVKGDDCVVGCFDYKGGTALYVVNYSRFDKADILVEFDDTYRYTVIQRADVADVVGSSIPLTLDMGEGALIVLE